MTVTSHPPKHSLILELADELRQHRLSGVNDDGAQRVVYSPIGEEWVLRFLMWHPWLQTVYSKTIERPRLKEVTYEVVEAFYKELEKVVTEFNISPENQYNTDETGSSIGTIQTARVVVDTTLQTQMELELGRQEWVTCQECICADGTRLPPLIIFNGKNLCNTWIPKNREPGTSWASSSKGWTSNDHAYQWLVQIFEPQTWEKANGEWRLLTCDGHDSHISAKFLGHCIKHRIKLLLLPPHSSHLLQPLDVGVFSSLKQALSTEQRRYFRAGMARLEKVEWAECYFKARSTAITVRNVRAGWKATGIYPINSSKVLDQIPHSSNTQNDTTSSLEINDISFSKCIISDITTTPILRSVHTKLNHLAVINAINTPARRLIPQLNMAHEIALATNKLLKMQLKETQDILGARKERQSGKRKVLKGHFMVSTEKFQKQIEECEKASKKTKRPRKERKASEVIRVDDSDNNEEGDERGEAADRAILDCMVVE